MASFQSLTIAFVTTSAMALAVWQGCSVYDESLLMPGDGGGDVGSDAGPPDTGDGCNHTRWPGRPSADDDASVQNIEFYNALEILDFGVGDGGVGKIVGVDLDNICTCPGPDSCNPFVDAGMQCDDDGGV